MSTNTTSIPGVSLPASTYNRIMLRRLAANKGVWLGLPVAMCGVVAVVWGIKWALATTILAIAAIIFALPLVYFSRALSPRAQWAIAEKDITFTDTGVSLHFTDPRRTDKEIRWTQFNALLRYNDHLLLIYRDEPEAFLSFPYTSVTPEQLAWIAAKISNRT